MSNPLFKNGQMPSNPMQHIGKIVNDVRMLQQNPSQLAQYLSDHGMIDASQLSNIQNMNPSQIGQYLMQSGVMPQSGIQQAMSSIVPLIQRNM